MAEKVKAVELDQRLQEYIASLHKAMDVVNLRDAVQATTDEEITSSSSRTGTVADLFNRIRNRPPGNKLARFGDAGYLLPLSYKEEADKYKNMAVRPDDVWVLTFPRSGTTWTQELVWLVANDLDYETASRIQLRERYINIDANISSDYMILNSKEEMDPLLEMMAKAMLPFEVVDSRPSPRFLKSHLPFSLLPEDLLDTSKVVFVARDPRDVAVSYYHLRKRYTNYGGDFKTFWKLFVDDLLLYAPYFPRLKEAWARRDHPNMLFMFYEDMVNDQASSIKRMARFFAEKITNEQVVKLCEHLDMKNFRKNDSVIPAWYDRYGLRSAESFARKGKAGGWREYFDEEMAAQAQHWVRGNLVGCDLRFPADAVDLEWQVDKPTYVSWAVGALDADAEPTFHRLWPRASVSINVTQQPPAHDCFPFAVGTAASPAPWETAELFDPSLRVFEFALGPSGGARGPAGRPGAPQGAALAWYVNGQLAPDLQIRLLAELSGRGISCR